MFSWFASLHTKSDPLDTGKGNPSNQSLNDVIDVESNVVVVGSREGRCFMESWLAERAKLGRTTYLFSNDSVDAEDGLPRVSLEDMDGILQSQRGIAETFDTPPTTLIVDSTIDHSDPRLQAMLQSAKQLHLSVVVLVSDLHRIPPIVVSSLDYIVLLSAFMSRKQRLTCYDTLLKKANLSPVAMIAIRELGKRERSQRGATVICPTDGSHYSIKVR